MGRALRTLSGCFLLPLICATSGAASPPSRVLRVALNRDFVTLDWTKSINEIDRPILENLQPAIMGLDARGQSVPVLAESFKASSDQKTYRFTLRAGLRWSDGKPLDSQQCVDGLKRLLSPLTASSYSYLLFDVVNAQAFNQGTITDFSKVGIHAIDERSFEVTLSHPVPRWETRLAVEATAPVRDDLIQKYGNLWTRPGTLVDLGPFVLTSHDFGNSIVLKRNPYYPKTRGNVTEADFNILSDDELLPLLSKEKVDLVFKPSARLRTLLRGRSELHWLPPLRTKRLSFNLKQFPMSDVRVREMFARVFDRAKLAKSLGPGYVAGSTLVPPGFDGYLRTGGESYDVTRARTLFQRAGTLLAGAQFSLLVPTFDENREENVATAEFIKGAIAAALKLPIDIHQVDQASDWPLLARSDGFSMILHDWKPDVPISGNYYSIYTSGAHLTAPWSNAEYDRLVEQAHSASMARKKAAFYRDADHLLTQVHAVVVPLFYASEAAWVNPRVRGFQADAFNLFELKNLSLP